MDQDTRFAVQVLDAPEDQPNDIESSRSDGDTGVTPHLKSKIRRMNSGTQRGFQRVLLLCVLPIIACAIYTIFFKYQASLNSDGADPALIARLAMMSGTPIPTNWTYANGDLWLLGPRIFDIIAYPFVGLRYLLTAISDLCVYFYLLIVVFGTCALLAPRRMRAGALAIAIAAGGLCAPNFEFVIGQAAYSMYAGLALCLFTLVATTSDRPATGGSWMTLTLTGVAAGLVCISNPTRGLVTIVAPLVGGWVAARTLRSYATMRERLIALGSSALYAAVVGAAIGSVIYYVWLIPHIIDSSGASQPGLASITQMVHHAQQLSTAWLTYFTVSRPWPFLSGPARFLQLCVWTLSVLFVASPLYVIATRKLRTRRLTTFAWVTVASYAVPVVALIVLPDLFIGPTSIRYLTFGVYAGLCVTGILLTELMNRFRLAQAGLLLVFCGIAFATIAAWREAGTPGGVTYSQRIALIRELRQQHVGTVLATYWNSHVLTVLSSGSVDVYPVMMSDQIGVQRFAQNSPLSVINGTAGTYQAVALTRTEATTPVWNAITTQLGAPLRTIQSGPFDVWIYDRDIARLVYDYRERVDAPVPSNLLSVALSRAEFPACESQAGCTEVVTLTNTGERTLASIGTKPLRLGIIGIGSNGQTVDQDLGRADFPVPVAPGASQSIRVVLPDVTNSAITGYRLCLLQELVAWHCARTTVTGNDVPATTAEHGPAPVRPQAATHESFHAELKLMGSPELANRGSEIVVTVRVKNTGTRMFGSGTPPYGVNLGAHSINATGAIVNNDLARGHLPQIAPGANATATIRLPVDKLLGKRAEILPVAEGVAWFDKWGTRPLIVGPFNACGHDNTGAICNAAGKPLQQLPNIQDGHTHDP